MAGLLICSIFLVAQVHAQQVRYAVLKGMVIDSVSRQPIEAATVSIFLVADSALVNYAITNKKGEFLLRDIPTATPCRLLVSYSGLSSFMQDLTIPPGTKEFSIKNVQLRKAYAEMEEVIVTARRPPVLFKKDTIEFDAGVFKTPVNGVLEDLMKLLPGLEVDEKGNITVNGKRVAKITVDGKDFFGNDFKIASKNLPRDIVDKIQVMDYKSREALFNRTITGNEEKVINITLKKDRKKGVFGRVGAGYGTDGRYESGASLNYMEGPLQLNAIGNFNNVNKIGASGGDFSIGKLEGMTGSGGRGITETKAGGLNFGSELGKKLRLNGSYFYNNSLVTNASAIRRQNILPDTSFFYNGNNKGTDGSNSHRINLGINYSPDSTTELWVNAAYNFGVVRGLTSNQAISSEPTGEPINVAWNDFTSRSSDRKGEWEMFLGRRLKKEGRAFSITMSYSQYNRSAHDSNKGNTVFYQPTGDSTAESLNQQGQAADHNNVFGLSAAYTEPLSRALSMTFQYGYNNSSGQANKITHRLNPLTGQYDQVDTLFSNELHNHQLVHAPGWSIGYSSDKLRASLGAKVQWLQQEIKSGQSKYELEHQFTNIFPAANLAYNYSKTGSISLNYSGRSQQPSQEQLQPVPDNSNNLYLRLGNPELKPAFFHNVEVNVQQANSKGYWRMGLVFNTIQNQIVESTWFDSVQVSKPVNSNGNYYVGFSSGFSRTWRRKKQTFRVSTPNHVNYRKNLTIINGIENITHMCDMAQRIALSYTFKEVLTIIPDFMIRYLRINYSLQPSGKTENITKTFNVKLLANWPQRFVLENDFQYTHNSQTAPGFPKGVTLWNLALNYQLFQEQQGMLRLAVFDLLKQNTSVYRGLSPGYVEDVQYKVLQQYFVFSFIYNLKQLK